MTAPPRSSPGRPQAAHHRRDRAAVRGRRGLSQTESFPRQRHAGGPAGQSELGAEMPRFARQNWLKPYISLGDGAQIAVMRRGQRPLDLACHAPCRPGGAIMAAPLKARPRRASKSLWFRAVIRGFGDGHDRRSATARSRAREPSRHLEKFMPRNFSVDQDLRSSSPPPPRGSASTRSSGRLWSGTAPRPDLRASRPVVWSRSARRDSRAEIRDKTSNGSRRRASEAAGTSHRRHGRGPPRIGTARASRPATLLPEVRARCRSRCATTLSDAPGAHPSPTSGSTGYRTRILDASARAHARSGLAKSRRGLPEPNQCRWLALETAVRAARDARAAQFRLPQWTGTHRQGT